jgi:hypothetical protein
MGNCTITVHLTGAHHNKKNPNDANRMAAKFVDQLKDAGHNVEAASITHGGREDLLDPNCISRSGFYDAD